MLCTFAPEKECLRERQGIHYDGKISVTKSGYRCIAKPDAGIPTETPFCRNPDGDSRPWCYVDNATVFWEFCDIPPCGEYFGMRTALL